MSRLHFKGGAWTNAEDQVLKAALAQYGLRDWQRVASMLSKKTAAQCSERWENYLDPRLNLQEAWGPEEEKQLVQLQAIFPNQWRLISEQLTVTTPSHFVRPPWLCEQRYLEIRDAFDYEQKKAQAAGSSETAEAQAQTLREFMLERRRRRGMYQSHEERASKADAVDAERSEKEMMTMAVARLANQDQKKGLRKERQRQLAETSFLAKLESNREAIESGTLSARQERRMRKALDEDHHTVKKTKTEAEGSADDDVDDDEPFELIDVVEDQARAGIEKKSRRLMVNLSKQQNHLARVAASDHTSEDNVLKGIQHSLLRQITSAAKPTSDALPSISGGGSGELRESRTDDTHMKTRGGVATRAGTITWDTLVGPSTELPDLDALFASLEATGESQLPGDVRIKEEVPVTSAALPREGMTNHQVGKEDEPIEGARVSFPEAVEATALVATELFPSSPVPSAPPRQFPTASTLVGPFTESGSWSSRWDEQRYLRAARQRVSVETERMIIAKHRQGSRDEADQRESAAVPLPPGTVNAKRCVDQILGLYEGSEATAARAVQTELQYWCDVPADIAIRKLEDTLRHKLKQVADHCSSAHQWVENMAKACYVDTRDCLVYPYLGGTFPRPRDADGGRWLMSYLWRYWVAEVRESYEKEVFLRRLRAMEADKMRRDLGETAQQLQELQKTEKALQEAFRAKSS